MSDVNPDQRGDLRGDLKRLGRGIVDLRTDLHRHQEDKFAHQAARGESRQGLRDVRHDVDRLEERVATLERWRAYTLGIMAGVGALVTLLGALAGYWTGRH